MALTADILASWRRPRAVVRRLRGAGRSEPFAFSFLLVFLMVTWIALAPTLARQAALEPQTALAPRLFAAGLGLLALIPGLYLLAALGHLVARLMGGRGSFYDGRLALFFALAAISPATLFLGLVRGMVGDTGFVQGLGFAIFFAFVALYSLMLREVEGQ